VRVEDKRGSESCVCIGKQRGVQAKEGSTKARARLKSTLSGPNDGAHVTTLRDGASATNRVNGSVGGAGASEGEKTEGEGERERGRETSGMDVGIEGSMAEGDEGGRGRGEAPQRGKQERKMVVKRAVT
jgi:hypothetical protein